MSKHWSEHREGGGRFALWLIFNIGLRCGRGCVLLLARIVGAGGKAAVLL